MSTAATTRPSSGMPWSPHPPSRSVSKSSSTPHLLPSRTPGSVGQVASQALATKSISPRSSRDPRTSSPNYFEFVVDPNSNPTDSNAVGHAKKNWSPGATGFRQCAGPSPRAYPADSHPKFEAFRRQSQNGSFNLNHGSLSHFSLSSGIAHSSTPESGDKTREGATTPKSRNVSISTQGRKTSLSNSDCMEIDSSPPSQPSMQPSQDETPSFFDIPRNQSPSNSSELDLSKMQKSHASHVDERHRPNSLPHRTAGPPSPAALSHLLKRAETLPSSLTSDSPTMVYPHELVEIIKNHLSQDILLLDLRVFPQYSQSRISGALNLCIPTTLLKRPSFNVQKLAETFTKEQEKAKFSQWRAAKAIVVYDTSSAQLKDATSSVNTLKKFTCEDWQGSALVVRGGFAEFSKRFPDLVDKRPASEMEGSSARKLAIDPQVPIAAPVAGGCVLPSAKTAVNPFFGNIRQNMDLIGGVGQVALELPSCCGVGGTANLPPWLRRAADERDQGKFVADQFLGIERAEQQRMQKALSANVSYGTPNPVSAEGIQIAGIEKGTKNRYKDMLPYDHSRVKLQNVPPGGCDYVNASHIKSKWSHRKYIATQAPVPSTFQDFWRVVWEQDARVIVMLTAEFEGSQRKCHPYWLSGEHGLFRLRSLSERKVSLETVNFTPFNRNPSFKRPGMDRRRSTNNSSLSQKDFSHNQPTPQLPESDAAYVIVRTLALSHASHPFEPMREITQLQYSSWPDFGTPAHPRDLLGLVEQCGAAIGNHDTGRENGPRSADLPVKKGERPVVVHCSAGCGRTGTFCTVDSVVDMLKRQRRRSSRAEAQDETDEDQAMDLDIDQEDEDFEACSWPLTDDVDLVTETVKDFRLQRLSMVQTLRQFVLCYESALEWVVRESPSIVSIGSVGARRSYHA
ncbi:hypothetical protein MMC07_001787 [Pseudocyphellaria aurata]|nr:hypothetical protein [Pseudocyphellaria aurata]